MIARSMHIGLALLLGAGVVLGGALFGTVKDENGAGVEGAEVAVFGKELTTKTDKDGKFRIASEELVDGNKYSVTVTADGYDVAQTVSVEMYEDAADMEPIEVEMYKTEEIVVDTNAAPMALEMITNAPVEEAVADTNVVESTEPAIDLIDVEKPADTNAPPAR